MINFLLGDVGHGKSTYIINQIKRDVENQTRSFLIVPEQETLSCESVIASMLPPRAQLYTEVLSFTRLANKLFREFGGLRYNYASRSDKNLIMYRAICEVRDELKEYKILKGREYSCVKLFLDAVGELKSYNVSIEKLQNATLGVENERLKGRLDDLMLVWSVYERLLYESFDDSYDDIIALEKKLAEVAYFKDANVYIDSFYGFTKAQLDVIYRILKQAKNVTIAFDCPASADEGSLQYAKIATSKNKVVALCRGEKIEYISFDVDYKHNNKAISYLSSSLWDFSAKPLDEYSGVELVLAGDEFEECEYVASKIKELIFKGDRYRDIAVIMRDASNYKGLIDYAFKKYDIPYFFSTSVDVMSMPVVKMVFSALKAISTYRPEDVISYVKCSYLDISEEELNELENYIFRWNIYGKRFKDEDYWASNPDGFVASMTPAQERALALVHSARKKVLSKLSILEGAFNSGKTVESCARGVFEFLKAHNTKERIEAELSSCTKQEAYELSQVWNVLLGALDSLSSICGSASVSADDFSVLLAYALSEAELGSIPTGNDVVVIGDARTIRAKNIKHSFVLGVNEGVFPADIKDDGFFSDTDKITLESLDISLSSMSDTRADDELLSFKNAICSASDTVTILCLKSNLSGSELQPSIAFSRIRDLLSGIEPVNTSMLSPIDKIYSRQGALEYLGHTSTAIGVAVKEYFNIDEAIQADFTNTDSFISESDAKDAFGKHITLSKTSIESFASCHFKFYCTHVLRLNSSNRITFASNDIGVLCHLVIERFFRLCKNESFDASSLTDKDIEGIVQDITSEYIMLVCRSASVSKRLKYLFNKLKKNLVVYLKNLIAEFAQSDFVPEFFELSLTGDGLSAPKSLKFKIGENATISLSGVADRVDIFRKDNKTYVRIVDYKSGSDSANLEFLSKGFGLQMFIYLFTLCKLGDCSFKERLLNGTSEIVPAGIMYFPMNMGKKTIPHDVNLEGGEVDAIERRAINEKIARSGFFLDNIDILLAQDKEMAGKILPSKEKNKGSYLSLEQFEEIYTILNDTIDSIGTELLSGNASAKPIKIGQKIPCKYCEHKAFCRSKGRIKK